MGITSHELDSLINRTIPVPPLNIPRARAEIEQERKDTKGRVQYQRNLEENRTQWEAKMKAQGAKRRKPRTEDAGLGAS